MNSQDKTVHAMDLSECGTLRVCGEAAIGFVKTMFTGPMEPCDVLFGLSQGMLLTAQGEVIDMVMVVRTGDDEMLILTSPGNREEDFQWLQAHIELEDDNGPIFPNTVVEDQSEKLGVLLLYGGSVLTLYDDLMDACGGKFLFIPCSFDEPAYMVPQAPAKLLFVPLNIAPQIGDFLNERLEVETVTFEEYGRELHAKGLYAQELNMPEYHTPAELGLEKYLRPQGDFVGFRSLS